MDGIILYVTTPFVKMLSGVCRSGKSAILKMIAKRLRQCDIEKF